MSLQIRQIDPKNIPEVFPKVKHLIASGLKDIGDCTADDTKEYLVQGNWQLFVAFNAENEMKGVYVTTINYSPAGKIGIVISIAGKGLASTETFSQLDEAFKALGAVKAQGLAKKSAARLYKRIGFESKAILVEKSYG